jgi:uncharacterized membrane protein (UPF0127 family)
MVLTAEVPSATSVVPRATRILSVLRGVHWVIEGRDGAAVRLGLKPGTLRHRMERRGIKRT